MSGVVVDPRTGVDTSFVTGYDEAVAVLRDVDTFSNDHDLILEHHGEAIGWVNPGHPGVEEIYAGALPNVETLHFLDPPEHTGAAASDQPVVHLEAGADRLAADGRAARRRAHRRLRRRRPGRADGPVRGAGADPGHRGDPRRRRRRRRAIRAWSDAFVSSMGVDLDHQGWRAKARSHVETQQFFHHIGPRSGTREPGRRPARRVGGVATASDDGDEPFTMLEIVNAMQHLLAAGNETTTQAIGLLVRLLVRPGRAGQAPWTTRAAANAVEEALRLESPVQGLWRHCRKDAVVGETSIPAGSMVIVMFGPPTATRTLRCRTFVADRPNAQQHRVRPGHPLLRRRRARPHGGAGRGGRLLERLPGLRLAGGHADLRRQLAAAPAPHAAARVRRPVSDRRAWSSS